MAYSICRSGRKLHLRHFGTLDRLREAAALSFHARSQQIWRRLGAHRLLLLLQVAEAVSSGHSRQFFEVEVRSRSFPALSNRCGRRSRNTALAAPDSARAIPD